MKHEARSTKFKTGSPQASHPEGEARRNSKGSFTSFRTTIWSVLDFVPDWIGDLHLDFQNFSSKKNSGITLLLIVVLLSAILSISIGIFNIMFSQIIISGDLVDSSKALYAADQGIEKILYRDRNSGGSGECGDDASGCPAETVDVGSACYDMIITKGDTDTPPDGKINTSIRVTGQYRCDAPLERQVKRAFEIQYEEP